MINPYKDTTGIVIITCNREEFFKKCYESIDKECASKIYVVNGGKPYDSYPEGVTPIQAAREFTPVGINKNTGIRRIFAENPELQWVFVLEDDIIITDNNVWKVYIETAKDSGLIHGQLSYGLHGGIAGGNVNMDGTPKKRSIVKYSKYSVDFYRYSFAAFTLFHRSTLAITGPNVFDVRYLNAGEHLDLTQMLHKKGAGCPFHWHPDISDSFEYIQDIAPNHENSASRNQPDFLKNFSYSWQLFKEKFGTFPNLVSDVSQLSVQGCLEQLETLYSDKNFVLT